MALTGGVRQSLQDIYNGFRTAGLDHQQASNLAGVTFYESGRTGYTGSYGGQPSENGGVLNPGGAYGIAQFNGARQGQLASFAANNNASPSDPQTQYNFIAQDAQNRGINLYSPRDIVNRYEVPRVDLRPTEINQSTQLANSIDPNSYQGTGSNAAIGDGLGYASGGSGVDGSVGTQVQSESYTADSGTVVFGNGPDNTGTATGGIDGASFSQANVSGDAQNGSFGLGGITSGGQTVASGDNIAGWNSAGPVQTNPAVVGAINQQGVNATNAITKGDQKIGNDVKTAGQTIGQSITNASQSWLSWAGDSLLRLFVLIVGIALFAGALYYFGKPAIDDAVAKMPKVIPV